MNSWSRKDHAAMDRFARNRLPHNHHIHQEFVDRFCDELIAHDAWMWRQTCTQIRNEIDYGKPVQVIQERELVFGIETYTIWATLKSGQSIEMRRGEGGWSIKYGKPVERSS